MTQHAGAVGRTFHGAGEFFVAAAQSDIERLADRDVVRVGFVGSGEDIQQALFGDHLTLPFRYRAPTR
jgi:hypothetical protein